MVLDYTFCSMVLQYTSCRFVLSFTETETCSHHAELSMSKEHILSYLQEDWFSSWDFIAKINEKLVRFCQDTLVAMQ